MKHQNIVKIAKHKPKETSSNVSLCSTNSLKPFDIQFSMIYDKEKTANPLMWEAETREYLAIYAWNVIFFLSTN